MSADPRRMLEHQLQETVAALLRFKARPGIVWFSIPNELPASERRLARFIRSGMKPGVADMMLIIDGRAHFLELKTKTGRQSPVQRAFELECEGCGVPYALVRSFEDAERVLAGWGVFVVREAESNWEQIGDVAATVVVDLSRKKLSSMEQA